MPSSRCRAVRAERSSAGINSSNAFVPAAAAWSCQAALSTGTTDGSRSKLHLVSSILFMRGESFRQRFALRLGRAPDETHPDEINERDCRAHPRVTAVVILHEPSRSQRAGGGEDPAKIEAHT